MGRIVFLSLSPDETLLGFAYPKEEREALMAGEPDKFMMPIPSDMRHQWVLARLSAIDYEELRELIADSWRMCVPKKARSEYL
ncbi:MmcQ/YjbR family DNA-binding protein [Amycolatopsis coloradensis]|uniref:MmcQ/YjbR family DNA-binding protein n=1 Tax=Amycolatopsis coloradensis TaxID=76021 RepID=UPI001FCA1C96|nr:MmcQ/YjbR family DNA-binding protein [Amycolatopsis coloradensis]